MVQQLKFPGIMNVLLSSPFLFTVLLLLSAGRPVAAVIGGTPAPLGKYPGFVFPFGSTSGVCGAYVIHAEFALSAAHCANGWPVGGEVAVGGVQFDGSDAVERRTIQAHYIHPNFLYEPDSAGSLVRLDNDVLLLKVSEPLSSSISPGQLNTRADLPQAGDALTIVGVGNVDSIYDTLQEGQVTAISDATCLETYGRPPFDAETQFCADGSTGDTAATCKDSGSPTFDAATGTIVGFLSYGFSGCTLNGGNPNVRTRVSPYADWIQETICAESSAPPADCNEGGGSPPTDVPVSAPATPPTDVPVSAPATPSTPNAETQCIRLDESTAAETPLVLLPPCQFTVGTVAVLMWPRNGSLTVEDDKSIVYRPNSGFAGEDFFELQICSVDNYCESSTVVVQVSQDDDEDSSSSLVALSALVVIPIAIALGFFVYRRRKAKQSHNELSSSKQNASNVDAAVPDETSYSATAPDAPRTVVAQPVEQEAQVSSTEAGEAAKGRSDVASYLPQTKDQCRSVVPLAHAIAVESQRRLDP